MSNAAKRETYREDLDEFGREEIIAMAREIWAGADESDYPELAKGVARKMESTVCHDPSVAFYRIRSLLG